MKNNQHAEIEIIHRLLQACIREKLLPFCIKQNYLEVFLKKQQASLICEKIKETKLKQIFFLSDIYLKKSQDVKSITASNVLLKLIHDELYEQLDHDQWLLFNEEIKNCLENQTQILDFKKIYHKQILDDIKLSQSKNFIHYIENKFSITEQLQWFEHWATNGHPFHPCYKTKLGFNQEDNSRYSAEFDPVIPITLAAINSSITQLSDNITTNEYIQWFNKNFSTLYKPWYEKLVTLGLNPDQYYPIFIHPWQYQNMVKNLFHKEINSNQLIIMNEISLNTKATLSFRTLNSIENIKHPHIKLPVAVRSTSALRTVSPASIQNGPNISNIIKLIRQQLPELKAYLKIAYEQFGLHIITNNDDVSKHLGIIYRDNPACLVPNKHMPIVVASLFQKSPDTQQSLFVDLMHLSGCHNNDQYISYFKQYANIVLNAYFDIFLIYGIALEGHQQNTIAVFNQYQLQFLIARDLGGVRIHLPTLQAHCLTFKKHPNSATITENSQEVTNKFIHAILQCHLGEIVTLLHKELNLNENELWRIIKEILIQKFSLLKPKTAPSRWEEVYQSILNNNWQLKSLMRMRLNNLYNQYIYTELNNPLKDC